MRRLRLVPVGVEEPQRSEVREELQLCKAIMVFSEAW